MMHHHHYKPYWSTSTSSTNWLLQACTYLMHQRAPSAPSSITLLQDYTRRNLYFPMKNWDRLLKQAEITLNLLCLPRLNPRLSSYAQLNGEFDFNRTPIAPPGTITLVHYKTHNRGILAPQGHEDWYVRPVMLQYLCLTSFIPKTAKERVSDTTDFYRQH